jgi:ribosomal protein L11 methyltransferase
VAPDRWLVLHARSPSVELNALLAEGLIACGGLAVEEDGEWLRTYIEAPADPNAVLLAVRERLEHASDGTPVELHWEWREDEDWNAQWRAGLGPRRAGRHILVTPSWTVPTTSAADIVIVIDPQMAFGTGEHASTRGVLHLLEDAVPTGALVLDAGTGSAVLAIAAARLGARRVTAVDLDADAILNARENVERNDCADRIDLHVAEIDTTWLRTAGVTFDVIAANILSGVLRPLLPAFRDALCDGGSLLLGGMLETEADEVAAAARAAGFHVVAEHREEGWWSARFDR